MQSNLRLVVMYTGWKWVTSVIIYSIWFSCHHRLYQHVGSFSSPSTHGFCCYCRWKWVTRSVTWCLGSASTSPPSWVTLPTPLRCRHERPSSTSPSPWRDWRISCWVSSSWQRNRCRAAVSFLSSSFCWGVVCVCVCVCVCVRVCARVCACCIVSKKLEDQPHFCFKSKLDLVRWSLTLTAAISPPPPFKDSFLSDWLQQFPPPPPPLKISPPFKKSFLSDTDRCKPKQD